MTYTNLRTTACLAAVILMVGTFGCSNKRVVKVDPDAYPPNGTQTDSIFEMQEHNAEAAKFIVYEHEFEMPTYEEGMVHGGWRLNEDGEDHLKRIAVSLSHGAMFPVVVERSRISPDPNTVHEYPIHYNPELDERRRVVIVAALQAMGVHDADEIVVIAPSFAEGITGAEASSAYSRALSNQSSGGAGAGRWSGIGGGFGGGVF